MKIQPPLSLITASAIALVTTIVASIPTSAQTTGFVCGKSGGQPATILQRAGGNVTIIKWVSNSFSESGFDAQRRCQQVSDRFQQYQKMGALKYLTTGIINRQPVICVANRPGGDCARELPNNGLLFTVKPGSDARDTLTRLLNLRDRASTNSLNESAPSKQVGVEMNDRLYIDMDEYLNSQPAESASPQSVESDASNQLF
ncbi:COP23 domain-containing protein [Microcoleus sp. ARI1-B5]|uniref:COP23 domain-containing protein n=1 Tax=unclassified Microcoleus TaxID=2642155 RepID=UPI002FD51C6A